MACFDCSNWYILFGVYESSGRQWDNYFIGLINGFLIFCTAAGANESIGGKTGSNEIKERTRNGSQEDENNSSGQKRKLFSSWFH